MSAYDRAMRFRAAVLAFLLLFALTAGLGSSEARRSIRPKAGGYAGKVTNANGHGRVQLVVATFVPRPGAKPRKGPQLFSWTGVFKCDDGTTRDVGPTVFAPLHGTRFSGKSKQGPQTVTLHGRFTASTRMRGTARVVTSGSAPAVRCDTGPVTFTAHRR
jgi:hypothetical protein